MAKPQNTPNFFERRSPLWWILWFLRLDIVIVILWALLVGHWEFFFINILALALTFMPTTIEKRYNVTLPIEYHVVMVVFIYMAVFLGETFDAYERFFWWDALLHTASGVVLAFAAYLVLFTLHVREKLIASPFVIAVFTFSFAMALGGVWEIFEFIVDSVFGTNMQKNGLSDTMWDLVVDGLGALFVSVSAYLTFKNNDTDGWLSRLAGRFLKSNPHVGR